MGSDGTRLGAAAVMVAVTMTVTAGFTAVVAEECVVGAGCSQCPAGHFTRATNGSLLCCGGCAAAALYHGDFPSSWCACYPDPTTQSPMAPRMIRFPGPSSLNPAVAGDSLTAPSFRDALYILNNGAGGPVKKGREVFAGYPEDSGARVTGVGVSPAVQQALTLLADTLESLHARVSRLEAIIARTQDLQHSGSINRVGTAPPPLTPLPTERSCPTNYSRIGDDCYYVSMWHDYRAIWKDAMTACEGLDGKLAEPITRLDFLDLTRQISSVSAASGFSFWLGGLYPGVSWLWSYAGEEVTLSPAYWVAEDSSGRRVTPGDTSLGRCLSLAYRVKPAKYYFSADECGFEKYFICQLVEGGQQRTVPV
ncbi:uncharacterized protein LOC127009090 isoform X1 [Eriocheir sinensis]|uniref:uncharacterized protein LOC127009090 isoform X1 n=2 Tax=Eriocheir sinensis TaxID=95602 RepID=UPI0021C7C728|nr:uncharacterized protein LOC127009090 isoform X1 [Eriocheir sinensis]XP_050737827.1 uncharacterized protein LOC127009090 isoform X1 [Eriocheir sinensis]